KAAVTHETDDLVRVYLNQMGERSVLTPSEELEIAQEIDRTRRILRQRFLESDIVLRQVGVLLGQVRGNSFAVHRLLDLTSGDNQQAERVVEQLSARMPAVLGLVEANHVDFRVVLDANKRAKTRTAAWNAIVRRRAEAVRLIGELPIS